ncbi:MAG TPA: amidohydrolase [Syntrophomonadaceae bacterium]|nr:amidohydrolase [Syntrophomonadaceae bacterium]
MFAIKGGKIITMASAGVINDGIILVDGETIKAVGQDVTIPVGCKVYDMTGKYIVPGFIDTHTHIGLDEEIYRIEGNDVNEIGNPITPYLRAVDGVNLFDPAFTDALKGGVTRSLSMPGSANIIGGQAVFLKHLAENVSDMIYKTTYGLKAALGENPKRVYAQEKKAPRTRMANASLLREALYKASKVIEKGNEDSNPEEDFKQEAIIKVLKKQIPLHVHAHRADDILTALRIKDEFDFDLIIQHGTEAFLVADELLKRDVPVFLGPLLVNRAKVEMKEVSFKNAARLAEKGIKFSIISDHPVIPIEHLRLYAALAVREGLDEEIALQALTTNAAQILNVDDELGSISIGKRADLVVYDYHPFEFKAKVLMAVVDGVIWGDDLE